MGRAEFRFYEELNDFLPPERRRVSFDHEFFGNPAVKDTVEALGVPHSEVDLILANGESVSFSYHLQDGDRIAVYPVFESLDLSGFTRLRERPLREPTFILDVHLGKLARYLRLFGFDSIYRNDLKDDEIIRIAEDEKRIILTRDLGILKNSRVTHGHWLRSQEPLTQLRELFGRLDLSRCARPLTRCPVCNGLLERRKKGEIALPAATSACYDEFAQCRSCGQVYWKGSHYGALRALIDSYVCASPPNGACKEEHQ